MPSCDPIPESRGALMLTIRQIDFPTLVDLTDSPICSIMLRLPGSISDLVGNAIGGGLFATVMARLREKLGLVYGAGAFHSSQSYGGEWCLWAQTSYAKADQVISELGSIWADALSNGVPSEVWDTAVCAFRFQKQTQLIDPERRATLIASLYPALDLDEIRESLSWPFMVPRAKESFDWLRSRCRAPLSVARSVRS